MEMVGGMHAGQAKGVGRMSENVRAFSDCEVIH